MLDSTTITDPYIFCIENVLTEKQCKRIIDKFEKKSDQHHQGRTEAGVRLDVKNSKDLQISYKEGWKREDKLFFKIVNTAVHSYYEYLNSKHNLKNFNNGNDFRYGFFSNNITDTGYQLQRTEPGKGYIWHSDYQHDDQKARILTYIIYLNDVEEGWTQFYNGDQISPRAGRAVIFPATWTYIHQGHPPLQTKYLMTGWIHTNLEQ
tara:strand:+ start:1383 stop:2000 length:618 start_codon:yes stop_codon:yes gene_type:complete